jgi:hypothetical protein
MKIIEATSTTVRTNPKTAPAEAPSKEQIIRAISADARNQPEKFVKESTVPFGGE